MANERETAQTVCMFKPVCVVQTGLWGTVGQGYRLAGKLQTDAIVEEFWKALPQKVIVL